MQIRGSGNAEPTPFASASSAAIIHQYRRELSERHNIRKWCISILLRHIISGFRIGRFIAISPWQMQCIDRQNTRYENRKITNSYMAKSVLNSREIYKYMKFHVKKTKDIEIRIFMC